MLGSVLHTALSGVSAAELAIGVTANNLANSVTDGFKSSRVVFADQVPQTFDQGSPPSRSSGGRNTTQVGRGVRVTAVDGDFSQGPVSLSGDPLDLALEGDGFFVLEGINGEHLFTRGGRFQFNGKSELVSDTGLRVLGFNVDGSFQLDTSNLEPIQVRSGPGLSESDLTGFAVGEDGTIRGHFTDGSVHDLGQIQLAAFVNPNGLVRRGQNTFSTGNNSGLPAIASNGSTRVLSGAREFSNSDMAHELINLSLFSTMFRANIRVLETGDELLEELLNVRRS